MAAEFIKLAAWLAAAVGLLMIASAFGKMLAQLMAM